MNLNKQKAINRKKLWVHLNFTDENKPLGYFDDHKSLNCGCYMCKMNTYNYRAKNKKDRAKAKLSLKNCINIK